MDIVRSFLQEFVQMDLSTFSKLVSQMLEASLITIELFALTILFAVPLGLLVALGRMSKYAVIRGPIRFYLLIMRGTPLLLQLIFFYFGPFWIFGVTYDRFVGAVVAFSLNYAAYFAEIYRSGIESIPKGQWEAGEVLGFTKAQTFFKIILPQVIKRILPPMGSEFMTLVKDTALAQVIGVAEIFRLANQSSSTNFSVAPLVVAGVFYLIINAVVSKGFSIAEKKLSYYR